MWRTDSLVLEGGAIKIQLAKTILRVSIGTGVLLLGMACQHFSPRGEPALPPMSRCQLVTSSLNMYNQATPFKYLKEKYQKMKTSPFSFYRGTNHLYWMDVLGRQGIFAAKYQFIHRKMDAFFNEKTLTWLQADMHVYNMGVFQNRMGQVVYDLNDFDEVVVGNYQLDVWRLAVSIMLIDFAVNRDDNSTNNLTPSDIEEAVGVFAQTYLQTLIKLRNVSSKQVFSDQHAVFKDSHDQGALNVVGRFLQSIALRPNVEGKFWAKWTAFDQQKNVRTLQTPAQNKRLEVLAPANYQAVKHALQTNYLASLPRKPDFFEVVDIARRLGAGTGSLGSERYYALVKTRQQATPLDYTILDVKEQSGDPTALPFLHRILPDLQAGHNHFRYSGIRISKGHKGLANRVSEWVGYANIDLGGNDKSFSVDQLNPYKASFPVEVAITAGPDLKSAAGVWGTVLAAAHSRADSDYTKGSVKTSLNQAVYQLTKLNTGKFYQLVQDVAIAYAKQVRGDFQIFQEACFVANKPQATCRCGG